MKTYLLLLATLFSHTISAQNKENDPIQCDSVIFLDGTSKLVQVQEVTRKKIIYTLCCADCAVPREFNKNEIDTIIYFQGKIDQQTQYLDSMKRQKEAIHNEMTINLQKMKKNAFFVNTSRFNGISYISANYELILLQHIGEKNCISAFMKFGAGIYGTIWGSAGYLTAQLGIFTGAKKNHFEISAGGTYVTPKIYDHNRPIAYPLAANVGWRFQAPNKKFIFRLGVGVPEPLYFGLGFSF